MRGVSDCRNTVLHSNIKIAMRSVIVKCGKVTPQLVMNTSHSTQECTRHCRKYLIYYTHTPKHNSYIQSAPGGLYIYDTLVSSRCKASQGISGCWVILNTGPLSGKRQRKSEADRAIGVGGDINLIRVSFPADKRLLIYCIWNYPVF